MSEPPTPTIHPSAARAQPFVRREPSPPPAPARAKPKLKKLRLAFILLGLSALALVSTLFGMLMAVASDLPALEITAEFRAARNSVLYSAGPGCKEPRPRCQIAQLTGNQNRILVEGGEISPHIKNAVIAVEDSRFYEHEGVDYASIARALSQDILHRSAVQGGSTITQQFVKNALSAQGDRSVFQKLRETALAYHLEREWPKDKILTQYLNTVFFGNGAYGIEAAVRTYFGDGDEPGEQEGADASGVQYSAPEEPSDPRGYEAFDVTPAQAALLAGMIASPALYDPVDNRARATERRNHVLARMLEQRTISRPEYEEAIDEPVPDEDDVDPPDVDSEQPYFTSWLTQQLVDRYGTGRVFGGGLKVRTTIDPELQSAAENAIAGRLAGVGPTASLVAIENGTGEVKAMVGGTDFDAKPFNLATNGHRQPGSAFKPFILVRALADGVSPDTVWASQEKIFPVPGSKREKFVVKNYEESYLGSASLWSATATSDNSVFAELGIDVGTKRTARMARRMGIHTKLSTNPAMTLGGLEEGVTPLEMAYAYSTIANKGRRVSGSLGSEAGPVGIESVEAKGIDQRNEREGYVKRAFPEAVGQTAQDMLSLVVSSGTGRAAQVLDEPIWGKTGTTENYGDAWFVGSNGDLTVAVWVGYPDKLVPMEYEFAGGPVAGGTYPAEIFGDFIASWVGLREARDAASGRGDDEEEEQGITPYVPVEPLEIPPAEQAAPPETALPPETGAEPEPQPETEAPLVEEAPAPQEPAPVPAPPPAPAPAPVPAPTPAPPAAPGESGGASPGEVPP
jgi:penicillin-binding protein 1A